MAIKLFDVKEDKEIDIYFRLEKALGSEFVAYLSVYDEEKKLIDQLSPLSQANPHQ